MIHCANSDSHITLMGEALTPDPLGAAFWAARETLIVSDLHFEKGSSFAAKGVLLPPYDTRTTLMRLSALIKRYQPKRVISLGDAFHDDEAEARMAADDAEALEALVGSARWTWILGNHDPEPPKRFASETAAEMTIGPLTLRHEPQAGPSPGEIAGHLHPCARVVNEGRTLRRRCFATDGERLIMPAIGAYTGGLNVLDAAYGGLFGRVTAWVIGDKGVYPVGERLLARPSAAPGRRPGRQLTGTEPMIISRVRSKFEGQTHESALIPEVVEKAAQRLPRGAAQGPCLRDQQDARAVQGPSGLTIGRERSLVFKGLRIRLSAMTRPLCVLFGLLLLTGPAAADQTDPRLDGLFEELRVGEALRAEENVARIIEIWADAQSDTIDVLYQRAAISADIGEFELAGALLDHVIGLSPNFAQGYALRGAVRLGDEDRTGALEDFSKALELEPRHFEVRMALAELLLAGGDKRDAYEMFQKVLEWNPHDDHARQRARTLRRDLDGQEI